MGEKEFRCKAEVEASYEAPEKVEALKPRTFREKWDNYWYHYKGRTILIVFLVAVFGFTGWQFVTKEKPDYVVMTAFDKALAPDIIYCIEDYLAPYGEDINGDGKVIVDVYDVSTSSNNDIQKSNATKMMAELQNGEIMLFIVDDVYFDMLYELDVFEENEFFKERDGFACSLRESDLTDKLNSIQAKFINHDYYIAKRVVKGTTFERVEKSLRSEKESLVLLERLIASFE